MKNLIVLMSFLITTLSCIAQIKRDSIVYKNFNSCLILYSDSTFLFKNVGIDIFPIQGIGDDTISYGKYIRYKNKSFYLYSHPEIMSRNLKVTGNEKYVNNINDSIRIILSNPFKIQQMQHPQLLKDAYFYMIELQYLDTIITHFSPQQSSLDDTITIFSSKPIKRLSLYIYPYKITNLIYSYFEYLRVSYILNDCNSNEISLFIPQFTACYIGYKRFNAQEVKILDDCTISIDKKFLLSKCKGKKFNHEWKYIIYKRKNPYGEDEE